MEYIELSLGRSGKTKTKIDADDQERLAAYTWCHHPLGYAYRQIRVNGKKKTLYLHREVLNLKEGEGVVDHIDGDKLNNRKSNLRWAESRAEGIALNNQNRPSYKGASSSFRGVCKRPNNRWHATVSINGKAHFVGSFSSEITAAIAAQEKRRELHEWHSDDPRLEGVKLDTQQVNELSTSFPRSKSQFSASSRGTTKRIASKTIGAARRSSGRS